MTSLASFPGLPCFSRSSASVYYTERKPKNKNRERPGNEAMTSPGVLRVDKAALHWTAVVLCSTQERRRKTSVFNPDQILQRQTIFPAKILVWQTKISRTKIPMTGLYHGKVISNSQTQLDTRPIPNLKPEKACLGMSYPTLLVEFIDYRTARNFCGDFNLANWQFFFTKLPKLIPPDT